MDLPGLTYESCFFCVLLGKRGRGRFKVKIGNGVKLCLDHVQFYLTVRLEELLR